MHRDLKLFWLIIKQTTRSLSTKLSSFKVIAGWEICTIFPSPFFTQFFLQKSAVENVHSSRKYKFRFFKNISAIRHVVTIRAADLLCVCWFPNRVLQYLYRYPFSFKTLLKNVDFLKVTSFYNKSFLDTLIEILIMNIKLISCPPCLIPSMKTF